MEIDSGRKKLFDTKGPFGDNVIKNPARYTVNEKIILMQSKEKEKAHSSEMFSIVYSLTSLRFILSTSITLHVLN